MANHDAIEFECPHCQRPVRYVVGQSGSHVRCPSCQQLLDVSRLSIEGSQPDELSGQAAAIPISDSDDLSLPSLADLQRKPAGYQPIPDPHSESLDVSSSPLPDPIFPEIGESTDPIALDGYSADSLHDVYGVMCHVCDTRIHVRPDQIGQKIECPICFTQVEVTPPRRKSKSWGRGGASAPGFKAQPTSPTNSAGVDFDRPGNNPDSQASRNNESDELQLSDPVQRPTISQDFGLPYDGEDLLKPQPRVADPAWDRPQEAVPEGPSNVPRPAQPPIGDPASGTERPSIHPPGQSGANENSAQPAAARLSEKRTGSRRERLAEAEQRRQQQEADQGFRPRADTPVERNFPEFEQGALVQGLKVMAASRGLAWRVGLCASLMIVGVAITEFAFPYGMDTDELSFWEFASAGLVSLLGFLPYYLGLMGLWLIGGFLFRDAASGLTQVEKWKVAGSSELTGTFLLFAFSFFIAGLPAAFTPVLMIPLRVLVGPLFLMSAWFNRSAFQIITVDIFSNARKLSGQWQTFYVAMATLAAFGLLAGFLFMVRGWTEIYAIDLLLSVLGVTLNVEITILFAILTGWHCGLVIDDLEQNT